LSLFTPVRSVSELWACDKWLHKLFQAAKVGKYPYEDTFLREELKFRWLRLCENNLKASALGAIYFCSEFGDFSIKRILRFAKIVVKKIWRAIVHKTQ
jgi:hypothetical protein